MSDTPAWAQLLETQQIGRERRSIVDIMFPVALCGRLAQHPDRAAIVLGGRHITNHPISAMISPPFHQMGDCHVGPVLPEPETIDRIRASWLGEPIDRYVTWLTEHRYPAPSVHRRVPMVMHFAEYAAAHGARTLEELPEQVDDFVEAWTHQHARGCKDKEARRRVAEAARNPVQQMLRLVLVGYTGPHPLPWSQPFAASAPGFFDYLRDERGLRPASIALYTRHNLRRLEHYLDRIGLRELGELSPAVLSGFLTATGQVLCKPALSGLCGQVRVFLRYLHREGLVSRNLSGTVDCPRIYRLSDIPRAISWDAVRQLLEAVDRRSRVGKRDYAILLLLVTYGLRAREVAALTFEALDWKARAPRRSRAQGRPLDGVPPLADRG